MQEASEDPLVISSCTVDGRVETLKEFFADIELCEKSLND